jgi:two-component system nitrogen regulation response regulator NtrX
LLEWSFNNVRVDVLTDSVMAIERIKLRKDDYQMIICDLRMPRVSGYELTKVAKALNPSVVVLLVSAFEVSASDVARAVSPYHADELVKKPMPTGAFVEAVRRNLAKVRDPKAES